MLESIVSLIETAQTLITNILYYSYRTGKFIIATSEIAWGSAASVFSVTFSLLTVIFEDFGVFLQDIFYGIHVLFGAVVGLVDAVFLCIANGVGGVKCLCDFVCLNLHAGAIGVWSFWNKIIAGVSSTLAGIKFLFVLCGQGMWFAVTIVPVMIFYLGMLGVYYIGRFYEEGFSIVYLLLREAKQFIVNAKDFFFDVPFEATLGLTFIVCIIYVISKFNILLYSYTRRKTLLALNVIKSHYRIAHGKLLSITRRKQEPVVKESLNTMDESVYCVICHERQKTILLLPCKHLCLCDECQKRMRQYERRCPVCRTYISKTMKVFV